MLGERSRLSAEVMAAIGGAERERRRQVAAVGAAVDARLAAGAQSRDAVRAAEIATTKAEAVTGDRTSLAPRSVFNRTRALFLCPPPSNDVSACPSFGAAPVVWRPSGRSSPPLHEPTAPHRAPCSVQPTSVTLMRGSHRGAFSGGADGDDKRATGRGQG